MRCFFVFENKKKLFVIISCTLGVGLLLFLIICLVMNKINNINKFKYEYEKLNDVESDDGKKYLEVNILKDNKMRYVSYDEVFEVFDKKNDAVIYIGYPKCLYCRSVAQVLTDTANETNIDEIYYLDVEKKIDGYDELVKILKDKFYVDDMGDDKIYVPSVLFVADGKIVTYNKGTLFSHKDPYKKLDQSQIEGLSRIYKSGINTVIERKNIK